MDFLENVKNVVTDTAQVVIKKSGELIESSKVKYEIFDLKNDIKKLYAEIGKLTYLAVMHNEENADEIQLKCDIIAEKSAKIEALKNNATVSEYKCPSCGRKSDSAGDYCPSCGSSMTVDVDVEVETESEEN